MRLSQSATSTTRVRWKTESKGCTILSTNGTIMRHLLTMDFCSPNIITWDIVLSPSRDEHTGEDRSLTKRNYYADDLVWTNCVLWRIERWYIPSFPLHMDGMICCIMQKSSRSNHVCSSVANQINCLWDKSFKEFEIAINMMISCGGRFLYMHTYAHIETHDLTTYFHT